MHAMCSNSIISYVCVSRVHLMCHERRLVMLWNFRDGGGNALEAWKHYPAVIHCLLTKVINENNHTTILYHTIYRSYI